jgi:hypothetical protein
METLEQRVPPARLAASCCLYRAGEFGLCKNPAAPNALIDFKSPKTFTRIRAARS